MAKKMAPKVGKIMHAPNTKMPRSGTAMKPAGMIPGHMTMSGAGGSCAGDMPTQGGRMAPAGRL